MSRAERMARTKRVFDEHGQELVRRYEAGESLPRLAAEFDLHVGSLSNAIKRMGGTIRTHNPQIKQSREAVAEHGPEMVRRYLSGEDARSVGASFGVGGAAVLRAVRAVDGEVRPRGSGVRAYGPDNPAWRGGSYMKDGYRMVWVDPAEPIVGSTRRRNPYMPEHRLVMTRAIGRHLRLDETVHHINGDRLDNRLENLQLRSGRHGAGVHYRCHDCGSQNVGPVEL